MRNLCALLSLLLAGCPKGMVVMGMVAPTGTTGSTTGAAQATVGASTTGASQTTVGAGSSGTTGGTRASGSSASSTGTTGGSGSTGGSTGDGGACVGVGATCQHDSDCCTGACNGTCAEPFGQKCFAGDDCTSGTCTNGACACSSDGGCAVDQDCCNGMSCEQLSSLQGIESGQCCLPLGSVCENYGENCDGCTTTYNFCCNQNCVDNQCECLPPNYGGCETDADCCQGKCVYEADSFGNVSHTECLNGPGEPCENVDASSPFACYSRNCVDGGCGQCSEPNGLCASDNDCCSGLVCADFPRIYAPVFINYGLNCCSPNGLSCDGGFDCCSEVCGSDGTCACQTTSEQCYSDHGCCAGGACMPQSIDAGTYTCCQADSQGCVSDHDCCSGTCQNQQCGCVATGGACGLPGEVAQEGSQACCSGKCSAAGACL